MKNMIRKAILAMSVGLMAVVAVAGAAGAKAPLHEDVVEGHTRMCMGLRGRAQDLVDEYEKADVQRRDAILGELERIGNDWDSRGCRARFDDVTKANLPVSEPAVARPVPGVEPHPGEVDPGARLVAPVGPVHDPGRSDSETVQVPADKEHNPDGKGGWGCVNRDNGTVDCYKDGTTCTLGKSGASWFCENRDDIETSPGSSKPTDDGLAVIRPFEVDDNPAVADRPVVQEPAHVIVGADLDPGILELR